MSRPNTIGSKVFCIGFHKTGTTTFNQALAVLSYATCPTSERKRCWRSVIDGDYQAVLPSVLERYDAFQDNPFFWPDLGPRHRPVYEWLYERYPDAKFILTRRVNTEIWLRSLRRQFAKPHRAGPNSVQHRFIYGVEQLHRDNLSVCAEVYERYNRGAKEFFRSKPEGTFIEACWETDGNWDFLCNFLGVRPPRHHRFPHANRTSPVSRIKSIFGKRMDLGRR